ncbi:uncharacterized protein LOC126549222 [Aphis gossypii]|uniref:uncharacterized protein LOC126549222 n=1 Tax=Aphis gossypii TaxID=80765 RepID=UPI0021599E49|nr:uncharacterized protein LOC126549222 [Aphis gossypii]
MDMNKSCYVQIEDDNQTLIIKEKFKMYSKMLNFVFVIIIFCLLLIIVIDFDARKLEPMILGLKEDFNNTRANESSPYAYVWEAIRSAIAPSTYIVFFIFNFNYIYIFTSYFSNGYNCNNYW